MLTMEEMIYELRPFPVNTNRGEFDVECPNCGKKKLHINLNKEVFHCAACGEVGGGCIDFWAIYRGICTTNPQSWRIESKKDMYEYFRNKKDSGAYFEKREIPKREPERIARRDIRNKTYSELLNLLTLSEEHKENLISRGLSEEDIIRFGFKSYPPKEDLKDIAKALVEKGCILKGVAGFYTEDKEWTMRDYPSGIIIPQVSLDGEILGFQVRRDKGEKNKYLTISSSSEKNGAKGRALFHFVTSENTPMTNVILTEGPLKGDIAHIKMNMPVLAIQGVNSVKNLDYCLKELKRRGTRNIFLAFDMDYETNENVKRALEKVIEIIKKEGLHILKCSWDDEFKGIDDYLVSDTTEI